MGNREATEKRSGNKSGADAQSILPGVRFESFNG
jgi:hypothetical protein